jgi:type II restriction enzyme
VRRLPANTPTIDFICPGCESRFQLKSQRHPFAARINDAAYSKMREAVLGGLTPNLFALHYDPSRWTVQNLILIPRFVFSLSCIERRRPLSASAQRHGFVGCHILLVNIPADARIAVVDSGKPARPAEVRDMYARLRPLERMGHEARGWTLDVLNAVRSLVASVDREEFTLAEVYALEGRLRRLHPQNRFVRPKIRQQLQRLKDLGFVEFLGAGRYRNLSGRDLSPLILGHP